MFKLVAILLVITIFGCIKKYTYRVNGYVLSNGVLKEAIWYSDTLNFNNDTAYYVNSDGSVVTIYPPYIVKYLK